MRVHGRARSLPTRLPGRLQLGRHRRGRRGGAAARQPRAPVHRGRAVREGQRLPRAHARSRPAAVPAAPRRPEGLRRVRADLVGRGAGRDRRQAACRPRRVRRRGDLAVPGHRLARLPAGARRARRPAAVERARGIAPRHDDLLDRGPLRRDLRHRHGGRDGPGDLRAVEADPAVGHEHAHERPSPVEVRARGAQERRAHRRHRSAEDPHGGAGRRAPRAAAGHRRRARARPAERDRRHGRPGRRLPGGAHGRLGGVPRAHPGVPALAGGGDHRPAGGADRRARTADRDHAPDRHPLHDGHAAPRRRRQRAAAAVRAARRDRRLAVPGRGRVLLDVRALPRERRRLRPRRPAANARADAEHDADGRGAARRWTTRR